MKALSVDELKQVELDILKSIDEVCLANNLQYFLAYGTLIGAIRHRGFIPWDDDIDIQMPRNDYNRMIELYDKCNTSNGRYKLISPYDRNAKHSFVKVIDTKTVKVEAGVKYDSDYLGVDVDIFPIDGMPAKEEEFDKWYYKLKRIYQKYYYCISAPNSGSKKYRMFISAMKLFYHDKTKYLKKAEKLHSKYRLCDCEYAGTMESYFNIKKNRTKKEYFEKSIDWKFEDCLFKVPVGYDAILTDIYGEYMKLPPKEKRITHHANNAFWVN